MAWTTYKEKVKGISQQIVEAQRPIRVLDSIKWDNAIEVAFRKSKFRELPRATKAYYDSMPLTYDPEEKIQEIEGIISQINLHLGSDNLGELLKTICMQYQDVVRMLQHRGTQKFYEYSKILYGSPRDRFFEDTNTVADLGQLLYSILCRLDEKDLGPPYPEDQSDADAVRILGKRLTKFFDDDDVHVKISDGIVADAAAGGDVIKIKEGATFSTRDIDILEVHEGWVHIATSMNGGAQRVATWLSKGPPRVASTQEGLAVLMEIFAFKSYPRRVRQINDRLLGIQKVEEGANAIELFDFYMTEGYTEVESYFNVMRVFRGGIVEGGAPFTKDISYCKGFIENYNFMRAAIRSAKPEIIPYIFVGKCHVDDIPLLYHMQKEGVIDAPKYLPPQFRDLNAIAVWMSFSSFLNLVDLERIQEHYNKIFAKYS